VFYARQTIVIGPMKSTSRCISYAPVKRDDGKNPESSSEAVLIGDDEGCVTVACVDARDLIGQRDEQIVYLDLNNLKT